MSDARCDLFSPVRCSDGGMKIEWVDDTHALGVFSTGAAGRSPQGCRLKDE